MKVCDRVRRTRIPRVRILFMLYLFEFFELNNLHVVMTVVIHRERWRKHFILFPIIVQIDYVHPKSVA